MPMKLQTFICLAVVSVSLASEDDRPILKESPARLVACIESTSRANRVAAYLNVTRDVARKSLRVYAVKSGVKIGTTKEGKYEIEVIYDVNITLDVNTQIGAYHVFHNGAVFQFAADQFASGQKKLGLRLIKLLADADPDLGWSTPTQPLIGIRDILAALEKNPETMRECLKDLSEGWTTSLKMYGPR